MTTGLVYWLYHFFPSPHISQKICCKVGKHHVDFVTSAKAFSTYGQVSD